MGLRVIGAGIGRTGTSSLKIALEQLGFEKCYHMDELAKNPADVAVWIQAVQGNGVDWDSLFAGYQSAVDLPIYAFYKPLMAHFPKAKVILTLRDPEAWYESASQTIFRLPPRALMPLFKVAARFNADVKNFMTIEPVARKVGVETFFQGDLSRDHVIQVFNEHNRSVQQTVPADRLLVYEVKEGWEPLCRFLEVPVPDRPYPHANTREEFAERAG